MSGLEVFPATGSVVMFARLHDYMASEKRELIKSAKEPAEELHADGVGRYPLLAVPGDFPAHLILVTWFSRRLEVCSIARRQRLAHLKGRGRYLL